MINTNAIIKLQTIKKVAVIAIHHFRWFAAKVLTNNIILFADQHSNSRNALGNQLKAFWENKYFYTNKEKILEKFLRCIVTAGSILLQTRNLKDKRFGFSTLQPTHVVVRLNFRNINPCVQQTIKFENITNMMQYACNSA